VPAITSLPLTPRGALSLVLQVGFTPYDHEALAREEEEARRVRLLGLEGRPKRGGREEEGGRLVRREWQSLDDDTFVAATSGRLPLLIQVQHAALQGAHSQGWSKKKGRTDTSTALRRTAL
jgi:hypothetical protein